jgi:mRNA-degrading endonuclease RelE of RelBE toxin-antitoxin system
MGRKRRVYELIYAPVVKDHLRVIERKHHTLIRTSIEERLRYEPLTETRNRKPLKRPVTFEAEWELRFGPDNLFRVFYDVDPENRGVRILAVGIKERDRLFIAGEEVEL